MNVNYMHTKNKLTMVTVDITLVKGRNCSAKCSYTIKVSLDPKIITSKSQTRHCYATLADDV